MKSLNYNLFDGGIFAQEKIMTMFLIGKIFNECCCKNCDGKIELRRVPPELSGGFVMKCFIKQQQPYYNFQ